MDLSALGFPPVAIYGLPGPDWLHYLIGILVIAGLGGLLWYMQKQRKEEE